MAMSWGNLGQSAVRQAAQGDDQRREQVARWLLGYLLPQRAEEWDTWLTDDDRATFLASADELLSLLDR